MSLFQQIWIAFILMFSVQITAFNYHFKSATIMTAGNYIDRNLGRKGLHSTATDVSDMSPKIKDQNVESMKESLPPTDYIVTLQCADQPGVVHAMTTAILSIAGNIIENQQYTDPKTNTFVMRTRFESTQNHESTTKALNAFLSRFTPKLKIRLHADKPKVLLMVTKESHCLRDLLYLYELGELKVEIPVVVSNQIYLKELVESHGLKFLHMPITKENKLEQEEAMTELMNNMDIDFVVLARYMQIISEGMCNRMESRIINIHHSFLPGFKGARPYHQAHERGVKLIGATAHFVTAGLDEGPIIVQDVAPVSHAINVQDFIAIGRDIERRVLVKAVKLFSEEKIFLVGDKTIVF